MKHSPASRDDVAGLGPLPTFEFRSRIRRSARRGRRHPAGAHAVAVDAAHRLRSGARSGVAFPNALCSLRSLRSNSGNESVDEARCARRPRTSAPHRHRNRPRRVPPAANATNGGGAQKERHGRPAKAWPGRAQRFVWSAEERRARGRARSALRQLTCRGCLSGANAVRAASSAAGHETEHRREVDAQRRPRSPKRCARPGRAFAATSRAAQRIPASATGRTRTSKTTAERHASRVARSAGERLA